MPFKLAKHKKAYMRRYRRENREQIYANNKEWRDRKALEELSLLREVRREREEARVNGYQRVAAPDRMGFL